MKRVHPSRKKIKSKRMYLRVSRLLFSPHASFWIVISGAILIILSICAFTWQESFWSTGSTIKADKIGQFGDFIGGIVGSIWALAGVILFYVALTLQRKEFQLQRQELRETRNVFEKQAEQMRIQQREQTFFNLLNNHKSFVLSFTEKEAETGASLSGFQLINNSWIQTSKKLTKLKSFVLEGEITPEIMEVSPKGIFNTHKTYNSIFTYLTHLIRFIVTELENNEFHHLTFYNNISNVEKLILGAYISYGLGHSHSQINFNELPFDYSKEFQNQDYYLPSENLPPLFISKIIRDVPALSVKNGEAAMPKICLQFQKGTEINTVKAEFDRQMGVYVNEEIDNFEIVERKNYAQLVINPYALINSQLFSGKIQDKIAESERTLLAGPYSYFAFKIKVKITFKEKSYSAITKINYRVNEYNSFSSSEVFFDLRIMD